MFNILTGHATDLKDADDANDKEEKKSVHHGPLSRDKPIVNFKNS